MRSLGFVPWATNCSVMRYTGAWGCEGDLTFVRPGQFNERLVRQICVRLGSCGPQTWGNVFKDSVKGVMSTRPWCADSMALMDKWGRCPGSGGPVNRSKILAVRNCLASTSSCDCCK